MALAFASHESHPMVDALLRSRIDRSTELDRAIDERDDMLHFALVLAGYDRDRALASYYVSALQQFRLLKQVSSWRFPDGPRRMLDFASGYGRLTRFLLHENFAQEITVSDILEGAMEFQREQFGVRTVLSTREPGKLPIADSFELIFVASLFTHLPPATFTPWLRRLASLLAPDGLLVFSVHDESISGTKVDGIGFHPDSESRVLDPQEYGSTWVTEEFIRRQVADIGPDFDCVRIPRALDDWQDVYVVSATPLPNRAVNPMPKGFIDNYRVDDGAVRISGWAATSEGSVARVELRLDDEVVSTVTSFGPRPDVAAVLQMPTTMQSGFECVVPHQRIRSFHTQVLSISAYAPTGEERILHIGTIESLKVYVAEERIKHLTSTAAQPDRARLEGGARQDASHATSSSESGNRKPGWFRRTGRSDR